MFEQPPKGFIIVNRMQRIKTMACWAGACLGLSLVQPVWVWANTPDSGQEARAEEPALPGAGVGVSIANLIYGDGKTAECFSEQFLLDVNDETSIKINASMTPIELASAQVFEHPFAVMSGEGAFALKAVEKQTLSMYLEAGGFVVASAGCSNREWARSFSQAIGEMYPDAELKALEADHAVFHTVYDISKVKYKRGPARLPTLKALVLDGRIVLLFSPDGLNDTDNAGGTCCCCGGNEIKSARQINVNLLAYAMAR